jgi:nucleoside-diphosphate-sugar epimerase
MHVLVAGCGWLGSAVARACVARGDRVTGIRRDPARASELTAANIEPLALDLAAPGATSRIPGDVEAIVACQAAGGDGAEAYRAAYVRVNQTLLEAARRLSLGALVYTGSTGVFGQRDGSTVDEGTVPAPASPSAEVLVEAERLWLDAAATGAPAMVLRLSGLYGPGRSGVIERVRSGAMALGPGDDAWTNWFHLDDAVAAVLACLDRGRPGAIYHGTDAHPARRREVVEWIAKRLGIPPPRREGGDGSPGNRGANRRVSGERTRVELGLELRWPSFREGLAPFLPAVPERRIRGTP